MGPVDGDSEGDNGPLGSGPGNSTPDGSAESSPEEFNFDFSGVDLDAELASLMEQPSAVEKSLCRALVVTPIDAPAALRAALDLVGSPAQVVGLGKTSAAYLEVAKQETSEADELAALLSDDRPLPSEVDKMARLLSKLTKGGAVALTSWVTSSQSQTSKIETPEGAVETSETSAEVSGSIAAKRYVNGRPEQTLSAGLVLAGMDLAAEELLLGRIKPEEVEEYQSRGSWTGWLKGRGSK